MLSRITPLHIVLMLCTLIAYILFQTKENVVTLESELNILNKQIKRERNKLHILKAEYAYLSSPERLKILNDRYLHLTQTKISQLAQNPLAPIKRRAIAKLNKPKTYWHYKKLNKKYLTLESKKHK